MTKNILKYLILKFKFLAWWYRFTAPDYTVQDGRLLFKDMLAIVNVQSDAEDITFDAFVVKIETGEKVRDRKVGKQLKRIFTGMVYEELVKDLKGKLYGQC